MAPDNVLGGGRNEPDTLTQKDIDQLLQAGGGTGPAGAGSRQSADVLPYNFLRPPRISRDRRVQLDAIYSRFALAVQSMLSSRLRVPMDVSCTVEQGSFSDYMASIANPCAAFTFELGPGSGHGAIDLSTDLAFFMIDRVFGGPGEPARLDRSLTLLERTVARQFIDKMLWLFREAWQDHLPFAPQVIGFESTPEMIQIVAHEDNVLVANLEVRSAQVTSLVAMCIPLVALETFLGEKAFRSASKATPAPPAVRDQVESSLRQAQVELAIRFPPLKLSAREVASLKVGQIIQTSQPIDGPIELLVNGKRRFSGLLGQYRRLLGLKLTHPIAGGGAAVSRPSRGRIQ